MWNKDPGWHTSVISSGIFLHIVHNTKQMNWYFICFLLRLNNNDCVQYVFKHSITNSIPDSQTSCFFPSVLSHLLISFYSTCDKIKCMHMSNRTKMTFTIYINRKINKLNVHIKLFTIFRIYSWMNLNGSMYVITKLFNM